jgi:prophage regulatory protein
MNSDNRKTRLIRINEVMSRVGLCKASIYNRIKDGNFPRPVSLGGKSVGWLESSIDQWIADRCAAAAKLHVV